MHGPAGQDHAACRVDDFFKVFCGVEELVLELHDDKRLCASVGCRRGGRRSGRYKNAAVLGCVCQCEKEGLDGV